MRITQVACCHAQELISQLGLGWFDGNQARTPWFHLCQRSDSSLYARRDICMHTAFAQHTLDVDIGPCAAEPDSACYISGSSASGSNIKIGHTSVCSAIPSKPRPSQVNMRLPITTSAAVVRVLGLQLLMLSVVSPVHNVEATSVRPLFSAHGFSRCNRRVAFRRTATCTQGHSSP